MAKKRAHEWNPPRWLSDPIPATVWFHDEEVAVYAGRTMVNDIRLWRENYRTMLDLDQLQEMRGAHAATPTDNEIIDHILQQGLHRIPDLAKSIRMNGVRVPLILSYKKDLLDGNRRFMACKYLIRKEEQPSTNFTVVPVRCLGPKISSKTVLKIIAEMNFLDPHKEKWPQHVRVKFAIRQFDRALQELKDEDKAYEYLDYHLEVDRPTLVRWRAVIRMVEQYVSYVGEKARQEAERFGRMKFQFFEEFYNKALFGKRAIRDQKLAVEAKTLLYKYIRNQQLTSVMKVRNFAEIIRYSPAREHLKRRNGNFLVAKSMYDDYATPKRASARVMRFCEWLENLSEDEKSSLSVDLKKRLKRAVQQL